MGPIVAGNLRALNQQAVLWVWVPNSEMLKLTSLSVKALLDTIAILSSMTHAGDGPRSWAYCFFRLTVWLYYAKSPKDVVWLRFFVFCVTCMTIDWDKRCRKFHALIIRTGVAAKQQVYAGEHLEYESPDI